MPVSTRPSPHIPHSASPCTKKKRTHLENEPIPRGRKQRAELLLGALLRVEQREHDHVHAAHDALVPGVLAARLAQAVVVDEDAGAGLEGGHQVLEDADGVGSRVVVHDPAEEVDFGGLACHHGEG